MDELFKHEEMPFYMELHMPEERERRQTTRTPEGTGKERVREAHIKEYTGEFGGAMLRLSLLKESDIDKAIATLKEKSKELGEYRQTTLKEYRDTQRAFDELKSDTKIIYTELEELEEKNPSKYDMKSVKNRLKEEGIFPFSLPLIDFLHVEPYPTNEEAKLYTRKDRKTGVSYNSRVRENPILDPTMNSIIQIIQDRYVSDGVLQVLRDGYNPYLGHYEREVMKERIRLGRPSASTYDIRRLYQIGQVPEKESTKK